MSLPSVRRLMPKRSENREEYKEALPDLTKRIALMDIHGKRLYAELGQLITSFVHINVICDSLSLQNIAIKRHGVKMVQIAMKRNDDLDEYHKAWRMKIGLTLELTQTRIALNSSANETEAVEKLLALEFQLTERRNQLMQSLELCRPEKNVKIIEDTRKEVLHTFEKKQRQINLMRFTAHSYRLQIEEAMQQYKTYKKPSKIITITEREFIRGDIYKQIERNRKSILKLQDKLLHFRQTKDRLKIQADTIKSELRQLRKSYKKLEDSSKFWLSIILEVNEIYNRLRHEA